MKNLTPHTIMVVRDDGSVVATIAPSGAVARAATLVHPAGVIELPRHPEYTRCQVCGGHWSGDSSGLVLEDNGQPGGLTTCGDLHEFAEVTVPLTVTSLGPLEGLPAPREGQVLIVSALVASHPDARGRTDLLVPGEQVRNAAGQVVGCKSLTRITA